MNDELLNNFFLINNLSAGTIKHYKTALRQYCEFNKKDLRERQVKSEEAKQLADLWGIEYIETSAKTNENCKEAFERLASKVAQSREKPKSGGCPCNIF